MNDEQQSWHTRSEHFSKGWEPFRGNAALQIQEDETTGPAVFLNPTRASFTYTGATFPRVDPEGSELVESRREQELGNGVFATTIEYAWTSRNNRKGRHAIMVREYHQKSPPAGRQPTSEMTGPRAVFYGILRMFSRFAWYDISWVNAIAFLVGSLALLVNAFLSFLPYANSTFQSPSGIIYAEASLGLLGSSLFVFASFLAFSEAVNAQKGGCFGWMSQQLSSADEMDTSVEEGAVTRLTPNRDCEHHHSNRTNTFAYAESASKADDGGIEIQQMAVSPDPPKEIWQWIPTAHELRSHFVYEIGFLANSVLLASSLIYFGASVSTLITTIISGSIPHWIRVPQIVGASGFIVASIILMIENQTYWLVPTPGTLGWNINLFITAGSVGLLLAAIFGLYESEQWAEYQFSCSYFWS